MEAEYGAARHGHPRAKWLATAPAVFAWHRLPPGRSAGKACTEPPVQGRCMQQEGALAVCARVGRIRDPVRGQAPFPPCPKGGKGLALEAGTVVRALFITIDNKV